MEKEKHLGIILKGIVKNANPNREELASYMGVTSSYLYKLYEQKDIKDVFFVKACQFMHVNHLDYMDTEIHFKNDVVKDEVLESLSKENTNLKDEILELYRENKKLKEEIKNLTSVQ